MPDVKPSLKWITDNYDRLITDLTDLVAIPSISTDGHHPQEIDRAAALVQEQMMRAGLQNAEIIRYGESYPYVYGEWLGAPGKPTVFLYAHYDVQPINFLNQWQSHPWRLTSRGGRLYGRGSADDKGAITAQLASIEAYLKTRGSLPVNIKMLVEGEEEVGSTTLLDLFKEKKDKLQADVIVVTDTEMLDTGLPSITYSLRGVVAVKVEVQALKRPVHSGMAGGLLPDSALALNTILSRLYWKNGKLEIPGFYRKVKALTTKERKEFKSLPFDEKKLRRDTAMLPGVKFASQPKVSQYEQTWRRPAVTVIALEASSVECASNQVLPRAEAVISARIVPNQDPIEVQNQLRAVLSKDPPWGVKVKVTPFGTPVKWWMTDPTGPAFESALTALQASFKKKPYAVGCGGSIGFVGPLAELFGGAPALLLGIEDPKSNAHAPNESLNESDFRKLIGAMVHLYNNLGELPDGKVK